MLLQRTPMLRGLLMLRGSTPILLLPPRKMRSWRWGAARKVTRGKVQAPRMDCGPGYKHQQSVIYISVTHVHEGDAPGVVTRSGRA